MNTPSYKPNYYSVDDILVTQERVPCLAAVNMPRLGFLDTSEQSDDLKEGQELELPLWIFLEEEDRNLLFRLVKIFLYNRISYFEVIILGRRFRTFIHQPTERSTKQTQLM